jgi:hypothetical protein
MADWYEVTGDKETGHVRATNTRTAFDKGFTLLYGANFKLLPGYQMRITVTRLRGGSDKVKSMEKFYRDSNRQIDKEASSK